MPHKSKFEREIDEILKKTDAGDPIGAGGTGQSRQSSKPKTFEPFSGAAPKRSQGKKRSSNINLKPGNPIVAGLVILTVATFTPAAHIPIALVGVVLLVIGYILWFRSGAGRLGGSTSATDNTGFFGRNRSPKKSQSPRVPDSNDSNDRGKIIDFRSPDEDKS